MLHVITREALRRPGGGGGYIRPSDQLKIYHKQHLSRGSPFRRHGEGVSPGSDGPGSAPCLILCTRSQLQVSVYTRSTTRASLRKLSVQADACVQNWVFRLFPATDYQDPSVQIMHRPR